MRGRRVLSSTCIASSSLGKRGASQCLRRLSSRYSNHSRLPLHGDVRHSERRRTNSGVIELPGPTALATAPMCTRRPRLTSTLHTPGPCFPIPRYQTSSDRRGCDSLLTSSHERSRAWMGGMGPVQASPIAAAVLPLSASIICPLIEEASSEARKTWMLAISAASACRL